MLGILFAFYGRPSSGAESSLASRLFVEEQWVECRRESRRDLAERPDDPTAQFFFHAAGLRGGISPEPSAEGLAELASRPGLPAEWSARSAYELGRDAWARGDPTNAWRYLSAAFQYHDDPVLYKSAGCMLFMLQFDHPELPSEDDAMLVSQLRAMRPVWTHERIHEAMSRMPRAEKNAITGRPGQWVVSFYRAQIAPAIGQRCSLYPSCSEYFRQASREYGLKGLPLIADRLVREPGVVHDARHPVRSGDRTLFADPLEDHTR